MENKKELTPEQKAEVIKTLKERFGKNMNRHSNLDWETVESRITSDPMKLWSLGEMEKTGGQPDVVRVNRENGELTFYDCSPESPKGRRSVCFDRQAQDSRKENKPENNAIEMAATMGVELLDEEQYRELQSLGSFDSKTSSWIKTPEDIRKAGGALFADFRYGHVFIYHNGAQSYYASRGFRAFLKV